MKSLHKHLKDLSFDDLIVQELEHYSIVNKPPFLSTLEDRNDAFNLLGLARGVNANYQVCHRLDKETSGIIVLAKSTEAYRHFAMQLEHREVKKIYHAVIHGLHKFEDFEANEPLYTTTSKSRVDFGGGKDSLTLISTLELFKKHTLIKCFPITGRMHQIRVHLSHHGAPIMNDEPYGGHPSFLYELKRNYNLKKDEEPKPLIERVALHASEIAFKNVDGAVIEQRADYPKDFTVLLKLLRKFN